MKSGYVAPKGNFEKEKRIRAARLKSELSTPPRMAKIPAAMMEPEARGVEVMHRFYSRETKDGKGNWGERVLDTSLSFRLDWVWKAPRLCGRPARGRPELNRTRRKPMALTKRQKEVLDYLVAFETKHGYAPSFEEIGRAS